MKNQAINSSAKRNTLASTVVAMVANGDTITPVHRFKADEIAEQKSAERARNSDLKAGAKNEQANHGTKKGRTTRAKAGKTNVKALLESTTIDDNPSWTVQDRANHIRDIHSRLMQGQIQQLDAFIQQGQALIDIKALLVDASKHETEKALDRAFGDALKKAGIGSDIIPRQTRAIYTWLAENADSAKAFVNDCLDRFSADPKKADKLTKSIATKFKAVKLSPYIIYSAMAGNTEKAERTAMDTAKAHIKQVIKESKLDPNSAEFDAKILEQAKALLEQALAEINV